MCDTRNGNGEGRPLLALPPRSLTHCIKATSDPITRERARIFTTKLAQLLRKTVQDHMRAAPLDRNAHCDGRNSDLADSNFHRNPGPQGRRLYRHERLRAAAEKPAPVSCFRSYPVARQDPGVRKFNHFADNRLDRRPPVCVALLVDALALIIVQVQRVLRKQTLEGVRQSFQLGVAPMSRFGEMPPHFPCWS
jgi:hypothetical protein